MSGTDRLRRPCLIVAFGIINVFTSIALAQDRNEEHTGEFREVVSLNWIVGAYLAYIE